MRESDELLLQIKMWEMSNRRPELGRYAAAYSKAVAKERQAEGERVRFQETLQILAEPASLFAGK